MATDSPAARDGVYLSPADEAANAVTHGIGTLGSIVAIAFFLTASAEHALGMRVAVTVFAGSMVLVYLFSTLSHVVQEPGWRKRMRAWDQGTIYLLIAGTYSPFIWNMPNARSRAILMATVWGAAALGCFSKIVTLHRVNASSPTTYVCLGWLPAVPLISITPWPCLVWMFIGGCCYTVGVPLLLLSRWMQFAHAGWHVMVILGSLGHGIAIYQLLQLTSA